jgi:chromosome segregation ATPase
MSESNLAQDDLSFTDKQVSNCRQHADSLKQQITKLEQLIDQQEAVGRDLEALAGAIDDYRTEKKILVKKVAEHAMTIRIAESYVDDMNDLLGKQSNGVMDELDSIRSHLYREILNNENKLKELNTKHVQAHAEISDLEEKIRRLHNEDKQKER